MLLVALMAPLIANAEQQTPSFDTESILRYVDQDLSIEPGIGFKKVRLGQSFKSVAQNWGKPTSVKKSGLFSAENKWYYQAGDSLVIVTGGNAVESIEVSGKFNSPFQTTEGARFGMSLHQVTAIYGRPSGGRDLSYLKYARRGIEFAMHNGVLRAMRVFPAARSN